jgi:hypothetical protein
VLVTVEEYGPARVAIQLKAERSANVTLIAFALDPLTAYDVRFDGERWTAVRDASGAVRTSAVGTLTWSGTVAPPAPEPSVVSGTFAAAEGEAAFGLYPDSGGRRRVRVDGRTRLIRSEAGESPVPAGLHDFRRGDAVTVRLRTDGVAEDVTATTRTVDGMVKAFQPMTPWKMPAVTLAGGEGHIIDLYAPLHAPDGGFTLRERPVGTAALRPGDMVRARVNPTTGRVFELWIVPPDARPKPPDSKGAGS